MCEGEKINYLGLRLWFLQPPPLSRFPLWVLSRTARFLSPLSLALRQGAGRGRRARNSSRSSRRSPSLPPPPFVAGCFQVWKSVLGKWWCSAAVHPCLRGEGGSGSGFTRHTESRRESLLFFCFSFPPRFFGSLATLLPLFGSFSCRPRRLEPLAAD